MCQKTGIASGTPLNVHVNEKHREYDSGTCSEFKARMIAEMRDARQEIAHMLGCAPDSFAKTLDAWMPDAVWADARTLLATGMLHASAIVIFNVSEQAIEVMSPWGTVDDATPLWLLMFEHDHFSPGVAGNLPLLLSTLEGITLEPWKGKRHLAAGGGSDTILLPKVMETSCAELLDSEDDASTAPPPSCGESAADELEDPHEIESGLWEDSLWIPEATLSPESMENTIAFHSHNVDGWRKNGPALIDSVNDSPCLLFVQETGPYPAQPNF